MYISYDTVFILQILRCISQLELAQLIGTGVKPSRASPGKDIHSGHPIEAFDPEGSYVYGLQQM